MKHTAMSPPGDQTRGEAEEKKEEGLRKGNPRALRIESRAIAE